MSADSNACNLNYDVGVDGVGVSSNETLSKSCKGTDQLNDCSSNGLEKELEVVNQLGGDGSHSSIKAMIDNFEGGELVESLDWTMKAAELLVSGAESGGEIDMAAIVQNFGLLSKDDVTYSRVLSMNPSVSQEENVLKLGEQMEVVDREQGDDESHSSNKAVIDNFEGGELVESLDWVMKAAELLVSGAESGNEFDMAAIAQDFGLVLKNDVTYRVSSVNPSIHQVDNAVKLGENEQVVAGNHGDCSFVKESVLIQNAVGSSSLQSEELSYYSLMQDFFNQVPDMELKAADNGVSSIKPENEPVKHETQVNLDEKQLLKEVDFKNSGTKSNDDDLVDLNTYAGINGNLDHKNGNQDTVIKKSMPKMVTSATSNSRFSVSNLVWGKITSHPWWPGQIYDPSYSSKEATSYFKKDSFLIAYFGDGTFAWNEASKLKPFGPHFSHMENQSNMETFRHAVDCALDEVASRVEFSLSCPCLPLSNELYADIKSQTVFNSGIKTESRNRDVNDEYSNATSFEPEKLMDYIKKLASGGTNGGVIDRLEHVIAKSQVLSISRWKGHPLLPEFNMLGGLFDNDQVIQIEVMDEQVPSRPVKRKSRDGSSRKRKRDNNSSGKMKKRSLSDLMAGNEEYLLIGEEIESEERTQDILISSLSCKKSKSKQSQKTNTSKENPSMNSAALILNFTDLDSVPLEADLNKIFSQYGPLIESETQVLKKSKQVKVVFKRRDDAETAFSSAGKYSTFGPSLVSYRLKYMSCTPQQDSASKRSKKTSQEGDAS